MVLDYEGHHVVGPWKWFGGKSRLLSAIETPIVGRASWSHREGRLTPKLSRRVCGGAGGAAFAGRLGRKSRDTSPGARPVGFSALLGGPGLASNASFDLDRHLDKRGPPLALGSWTNWLASSDPGNWTATSLILHAGDL